MKVGNFIDLLGQTIIIAITVLASLAIAITGSFESIAVVVMMGAFFLGPWQLLSSLITTFSQKPFIHLRKRHLISSLFYALFASIVIATANDFAALEILSSFFEVILFGVPAVLAVFYYYITFKTYQVLRSQAQ